LAKNADDTGWGFLIFILMLPVIFFLLKGLALIMLGITAIGALLGVGWLMR
jgi:hypothetical protein